MEVKIIAVLLLSKFSREKFVKHLPIKNQEKTMPSKNPSLRNENSSQCHYYLTVCLHYEMVVLLQE